MKILPLTNINHNSKMSFRGIGANVIHRTPQMRTFHIAGRDYTGASTYEIVTKYLTDYICYNVPDNVEIKPNSRFYEDLCVNSLDIAEMVYDIENFIGYKIPDREIEKFSTVQDVVNFVDLYIQP